MNISFIGLGKLGLPLACCLAEAGNKILCIDKNLEIIDKLNNQKLPFYEPGLDKIFPNQNLFKFTTSYESIFYQTSATIILTNTQDSHGGYTSSNIEKLLVEISVYLKNSKNDYHLFVLSSTVLPGTISGLIRLIENHSNKKYQEDFGFSYVPDFVKLGSVVEDFKNPEFFMIGANNEKDLALTKLIWRNLHLNNPPERNITLEESEIAKVALNGYLVHKITYANFLGELCSDIKNVNIHNITKTIGLDKRISPYFFGYGTPYGGTCFPRDTTAFIKFSEEKGKLAKHLIFAEEVNKMMYDKINTVLKRFGKICILGISFKPNSPVTIGSPSLKIINSLYKKKIYCHDFINETFDNLEVQKGVELEISDDVQYCINKSEVVVIMHPDKRYSYFDYTRIDLIDYWGIAKNS